MKKYINAQENLIVEAYEEGEKYYLNIYKKYSFLAASRSKKNPVEWKWSKYTKEFKNKDHANAYFKAIKNKEKTLKQVNG